MTTEEGNKLIAEFEGLQKRPATNLLSERYIYKNGVSYNADRLLYHTSWDWLMPAYFKCKTIFNSLSLSDRINLYLFSDLRESILSGDCGIAQLALVKFIQWYNWYNQNKTTQP